VCMYLCNSNKQTSGSKWQTYFPNYIFHPASSESRILIIIIPKLKYKQQNPFLLRVRRERISSFPLHYLFLQLCNIDHICASYLNW
jgi:hypothetical protein